MNTQFVQTDVAVVGGGLAGLTAAAYLARAGVAVTLFEKAAGLGGRAATQSDDGFRFNRGIHAFYTGGAASQVFQELGVTYPYGIPKGVFALQQGKLSLFPVGPLTLLRSNLLGLGDKLALLRLFATLPKIQTQPLAHVSIQDWLEQAIQNQRVRQLLAAFARTFVYSTALDLVSAEVFVAKLQLSLTHPIHYIDGGWQTLVDSLRATAEQAGARIVSGARVEAVEHQGGAVQGVRLRDGERVSAGAVLIAASPNDAAKLVDDGANPILRRIVDALVPAQVACLDVALRRLPDPRHPIVQDLEHPLFMTTQSLFAQITPEGGALIHAFKQLDSRHASDPHADERDLEALLDAAQPGWRDVLVKRAYLPHIMASGALPMAKSGSFAGRPDARVPGLDGLYLAGDWVGGEGFLIDASMSSARQAARLIAQAHREPSRALAPAPARFDRNEVPVLHSSRK